MAIQTIYSTKTYLVGTQWNHLDDAIHIRSHKICFGTSWKKEARQVLNDMKRQYTTAL